MAKSNAARNASVETETANEAGKKRQTKAAVSYSVDGDLENSLNSPTEECKFIHVEFADETTRKIEVAKLPANVIACATLQGVVTRFQRGYQVYKEVDKVIEAFDETMEDLSNGIWIEFAAGEPKVTQLAKAVKMALEEKGETVDDERMAGIIDKLKNSDYAEKAKANPSVMAHLAQLQLEAAQRRADERRKAAANSEGETLSDF